MFRFHLVKDKLINWRRYWHSDELPTKQGLLTRASDVPVSPVELQSTTDNSQLCAELKELKEIGTNPRGMRDLLNIEIAIDPSPNTRIFIRLWGMWGYFGKNSLTKLETMMERYGLDMKLSVGIKHFGTKPRSNNGVNLMTEAEILQFSTADGVDLHYSQALDKSLWAPGSTSFYGVITITCVAFRKTCVDLFDTLAGSRGKPSFLHKMLKEGVGSDATIISSDGEAIKCHKVFLQGQSDVFEAMFRSTSKSLESISSTIQMDDMCSKSVKALLAFLYLEEIEDAECDSEIALDLLKAAHKYNVPRLEERMKQVLLEKPNKWFDLEVAMQLYVFAKKVPAGDNLKKRASAALKANHSKLDELASYKQLFIEDPLGAMELCRYLLSGGPIASSSAGGVRDSDSSRIPNH